MFWSGVPRARSTFDIVSLATSLYMDVLPVMFALAWGLSEWDVVRLHWPRVPTSLVANRETAIAAVLSGGGSSFALLLGALLGVFGKRIVAAIQGRGGDA